MIPAFDRRHTSRKGFTLVELLVAMALILFIMSIVSVAFVDSTESFRIFRARAELSEKLRFITQTLRADLRANHFENNRRLSDPDFWEVG
ncbi:MAG: PilW family protein, partial [Planctomycetota bacterium]